MKDLQSKANLDEHNLGAKHLKKLARATGSPVVAHMSLFRPTLDDFVHAIVEGKLRNIVVCTGAGVSTTSGITDFRSKGGLYEQIRARWGKRFPDVAARPELVLSRRFLNKMPSVWYDEVKPWLDQIKKSALPSKAHKLCALLAKKGWLRRVYTQNVDGLHTHASLCMDAGLVVECHGSIDKNNIVLYDDDLPDSMYDALEKDFGSKEIDFMLVLGTSLTVQPFCAIPNLVRKGAFRAWVTLNSQQSAKQRGGYSPTCTLVPGRKTTPKNLFGTLTGMKKWPQVTIGLCCDEFAQRVFDAVGRKEGVVEEAEKTTKTTETAVC
jgi:NAD-dependent SIR2 family protein deacetylase